MPIYEYECAKCKRVLNFLVRSIADHKPPKCPKCGHAEMSRQMSRFASASAKKESADVSGDLGGDDLGDMPDMPGLDKLDENDPRSMGKFMREMAKQMGEPLDAEMDEVCRRLESGEDPEKIEEDMGDNLDGMGGAGRSDDSTLYDG